MAKYVPITIQTGYLSADALNSELARISAAFENTLSRDGTTPNTMKADLDMDGHALLNVGASTAGNSIVTLEVMQSYVDSRASGLILSRRERVVATAAQTLVTFTTLAYTPATNNLAVYKNGLRVWLGTDYTETSSTSITFLAGLTAGDKIDVVTNEFAASLSLASHSHPWTEITAIPETASRWPSWLEVTGKPSTFVPSTHNHSAAEITSGRVADAQRGVYVQASAPSLGAGDAGALWFW